MLAGEAPRRRPRRSTCTWRSRDAEGPHRGGGGGTRGAGRPPGGCRSHRARLTARAAFGVLQEARGAGLIAQMELAGRSLKGQLAHAQRLGVRYVAIVGLRRVRRAGARGRRCSRMCRRARGKRFLPRLWSTRSYGACAICRAHTRICRPRPGRCSQASRPRFWGSTRAAQMPKLGEMAQLARPFQIALVAVLALAMLVLAWFTLLHRTSTAASASASPPA